MVASPTTLVRQLSRRTKAFKSLWKQLMAMVSIN